MGGSVPAPALVEWPSKRWYSPGSLSTGNSAPPAVTVLRLVTGCYSLGTCADGSLLAASSAAASRRRDTTVFHYSYSSLLYSLQRSQRRWCIRHLSHKQRCVGALSQPAPHLRRETPPTDDLRPGITIWPARNYASGLAAELASSACLDSSHRCMQLSCPALRRFTPGERAPLLAPTAVTVTNSSTP
jgi:hypothetical protein